MGRREGAATAVFHVVTLTDGGQSAVEWDWTVMLPEVCLCLSCRMSFLLSYYSGLSALRSGQPAGL
jgi:hypothetical protein